MVLIQHKLFAVALATTIRVYGDQLYMCGLTNVEFVIWGAVSANTEQMI
jgi:hypothetical protein